MKKFVAGLVTTSLVVAGTVTGTPASAVIVDKPVSVGTGDLTLTAIGTHETIDGEVVTA